MVGTNLYKVCCMKKKFNERRLLITAYFWRFGIIGLVFLLPLIFGLVFYNIESLNPYTIFAIFISMGVPCVAMGIDYILGCILEFDHIILVNQSCYHHKMNPYNLSWNVSKKEFIFVGAIFSILGIAMIVLPFII